MKKDNLIKTFPTKRSKIFYEELDPGIPRYTDFYRFKAVERYISGNSVLDYGCGRADFLKLIKSNYKIAGIEINAKIVEYCNNILGEKVVVLGNVEEGINLEDNCYDTVVCLEVLEHLNDPLGALRELYRISRKRIIITVPFDEKIKWEQCIHCGKYTPIYGHLHSFNTENIKNILPINARLVKIELICSKIFVYSLSPILRLPIKISSIIDTIFIRLFKKARWIMIILDKV